uniref:Transmembrane protein 98 n=2 Tax=Proconiini TaxID=565685 RepID=A0A1B6G724_9HEMI
MELVVAAAIIILGIIFTGAFLSLLLICQHKNIRAKTSKYVKKLAKSDVSQFEDCLMETDVELGEVCLHPHIESILAAEWVGDATGLVSHCLAILKICHSLTNHVAALAMDPVQQSKLQDIIQVARRISIRADDMVRAMYPPLDARLLEARSVALVLSVSHLTLVAQAGTKFHWIEQSIAEMDTHLLVLREAALSQEAACRIQNAMA